jgi:hypothetical protein
MLGCSTPVSEPEPEPASFDHPEHKYVPYHHPHKNQRNLPRNQYSWKNGNYAFRTLQKRHERQNHGPMSPTRIDCGWIDEWSWNNLNRCLRTSYRCVSLTV